MNRKKIRLPLKANMSRGVVVTFAYNDYWIWNDTIRDSKSDPYEVIYLTEDEKNIIHYKEDHLIGVHYILLIGEELDDLNQRICSHLDVYEVEELFELISEETMIPDLIQNIYFVAVAASAGFDESYYQKYKKLLFHKNEEVRLASIRGIGYIEWKEFKEDLIKVVENDASEKVRISSEAMIKGIDLL